MDNTERLGLFCEGDLLYIEQCVNQCYGNRLDKGRGRQMPIHYGDKDLNFQTIHMCLYKCHKVRNCGILTACVHTYHIVTLTH